MADRDDTETGKQAANIEPYLRQVSGGVNHEA